VLLDDEIAEHIAGCNMAFRRDVLLGIGGFDPIFHAAGDDVDFCWRLQDAGYAIGYSAAATVWHFRRNTVRAYIGQQQGYGKAEALLYGKHPGRFNAFGQAKWSGRIYGDLSAAMLLWRKPLIYSGTFGRGLFQTRYQPPAGLFQYLPLTFEWTLLSLPLALIGIAGEIVQGRWWWLLALPLAVTWATCLKGGWSAKIDPRFAGPKARALVAVLIYLGPLLRGWSRIRWRLRAAPEIIPAETGPVEQRGHWAWRARGFVLSYWSDVGAEKEAMLGALMRGCAAKRYPVAVDSGWADWDLEIASGPTCGARILIAGENHGADKRLLRVRLALRLSRLARWVVGAAGIATLASLILGWMFGAAFFAALAGATGGLSLWQLALFARRLHRIVETAADESGLVPVDPVARAAIAVGRPHTA
jgi:hypothetical protein